MKKQQEGFQGMQLSLPNSTWLTSDPQILSKHPCYLESTQKGMFSMLMPTPCHSHAPPTPPHAPQSYRQRKLEAGQCAQLSLGKSSQTNPAQ